MLWVQWSLYSSTMGKVHMADNPLKTLCDRPIPNHAKESTIAPKDKGKICHHCQQVAGWMKRHPA